VASGHGRWYGSARRHAPGGTAKSFKGKVADLRVGNAGGVKIAVNGKTLVPSAPRATWSSAATCLPENNHPWPTSRSTSFRRSIRKN